MMGFLLTVAIVVGIPALMLGLLRKGLPELANGDWPERWRTTPSIWYWYVGAVATVIFLLFLAVQFGPREGDIFLYPAMMIVAAVLLSIWQREFVVLMSLRDEDFPGRHDKLIWAFLLIAMPPVGLFFFRSYRLAHQPKSKPARFGGQAVSDLF